MRQRYRLGAILGTGGFSTVYHAHDLEAERNVAIKQITLHGRSAQEVIDATDMFNREVSFLSQLCHPQIPQFFDHFSDLDHLYLVLQYLEGSTLETYLETHVSQDTPLQLGEVLTMALQLCSVLDYLHTHQPPIIFRDLKPGNIIRSHSGKLSLIDFGIARFFRVSQAHDTRLLGSPGYAAPEQYGQAQTTPQSDIYSLGIILCEALSAKGSTEPLAQLHLDQQDGRGKLAALALRMSSPDPHMRPATVREIGLALEAIQQQCVSRETGRLWLPPTYQAIPTGEKQYLSHQTQFPSSKPHHHIGRRKVLLGMGMLIASGMVGSIWWTNTSRTHLDFHPSSYVYGGHTAIVVGIAWSPDGKCITSISEDGVLQVWEAVNGRQIWNTATTGQIDAYVTPFNGENTVSWSPNGKHIAFGSTYRTLQIWDATTRKNVLAYPRQRMSQQIWGIDIAWSPDGKHIALTSCPENGGSKIGVWDIATGKLVFTHLDPAGVGANIAWSPDGKHLALANGTLQIWDTTKWSHIATYQPTSGWITDVSWSPDGKHIALANGNVQIWDIATAKQVFTCSEPQGYVDVVSWSPNGKYIASNDTVDEINGILQIWDASTGGNVFTYPNQRNTEPIHIITWSPNSTRIAFTYAYNKTVQVWEAP
ncbi:hypothetical protein KSC_028470 [Ktedonobacter sp. SOSP1-52]|nr:hypothetical protein KSC_028470 [Ktedonobacter sp. SOSP1-52]